MSSLVLYDVENNTFLEIIYDVLNRYNYILDYHQIYDECLELMTDNGIRVVTYRGVKMPMMRALDILLDILSFEHIVYMDGNTVKNPFQQILFDDLFDEGENDYE